MQHVGTPPKTISVKSKDHGDQTVRINETDFNPEIHEKVTPKKPIIDDDDEDKDTK